jgi:hypothetical protein
MTSTQLHRLCAASGSPARNTSAATLVAAVTLLAGLAPEASAQFRIPPGNLPPLVSLIPPVVRKAADFNADGRSDLAIAAPGEDYRHTVISGGVTHLDINCLEAGVVHVAYGSASGLTSNYSLLSRQTEILTSPFRPCSYQHFGTSLAYGDFNKDGYDDLAVGQSGANANGGKPAVDIYIGSFVGLSTRPAFRITQAMIPTGPALGTASSSFAACLTVGDINGDTFQDLVISDTYAQGRNWIYIIPGSTGGLRPEIGQTRSYVSSLGPYTMETGDFNGDRCDDLAMGHPLEYTGSLYYTGMVVIAFGTPYGLEPSNPQILHQDVAGIAGVCETNDMFGYSLASADSNRDGKRDLAIGAPGENSNAGVVHVLFGAVGGLTASGSQIWSQNSPDVFDDEEAGDRFGDSLAVANLETGAGDLFPELIVGIPGENSRAGGIQVLTIRAGTLGIRHAFWNQDSYEVAGMCEAGDRFGQSMMVGDFNGNGYSDLAIGASGENSGAGAFNVLYGAGSGLSWPGNQIFMQGYPGVSETAEAGDRFGSLVGHRDER